MMTNTIAKGAMLFGLFMLAGVFESQAHETRNCRDFGLKPVGLFVNGQPVEAFIASTDNRERVFTNLIKNLGLDQPIANLGALLVDINNNPLVKYDVPDAMRGIAGFSTTLLLQRIITPEGRLVMPGDTPIAKKIVYGKVRDYIFPGELKESHLSVDVCTDDLLTGKRELFHWDVNVEAGETAEGSHGFKVTHRDNANTDDPFNLAPMKMPDAALDVANPRSIWQRGLDHKLGAKGEKIKVSNVYYLDLSSNSPLQLMDRSDARYYESRNESCIDLFTQGHPPAVIGGLLDKDYCLGRCTSPPIYNSGNGG